MDPYAETSSYEMDVSEPAPAPAPAATEPAPSKPTKSHKRGLSWIIVGVLALAIIGIIVFVFVKIFVLDKNKDKTVTVKAASSLSATTNVLSDTIPSDWPESGTFTATGTVTYTSSDELLPEPTLSGAHSAAWKVEVGSDNKTVAIKGSGVAVKYDKRPAVELKLTTTKDLTIGSGGNASFVLTLAK